jgi:hypothetical protein
MRASTVLFALVLAVVAWFGVRWLRASKPTPHLHRHETVVDPSPVCPWREPVRDLAILFPAATRHELESRIVSSRTAELVRRLGRHLNPDENPLRIHRVHGAEGLLGSILVTRVKGAHGGIEIVIAVNADGAMRGVLVQSQREPEAVAAIITGTNFLAAFNGRTVASPFRLGMDLPAVPEAARASAQAIADGVRSQLVVLSVAEQAVPAGGTRALAPESHRSADILSALHSALRERR